MPAGEQDIDSRVGHGDELAAQSPLPGCLKGSDQLFEPAEKILREASGVAGAAARYQLPEVFVVKRQDVSPSV